MVGDWAGATFSASPWWVIRKELLSLPHLNYFALTFMPRTRCHCPASNAPLLQSKVCKRFQETGNCSFSERCGFAHGVQQGRAFGAKACKAIVCSRAGQGCWVCSRAGLFGRRQHLSAWYDGTMLPCSAFPGLRCPAPSAGLLPRGRRPASPRLIRDDISVPTPGWGRGALPGTNAPMGGQQGCMVWGMAWSLPGAGRA